MRQGRSGKLTGRLAAAAFWLGLWALLALLVDRELLLPSPAQVLAKLWALVRTAAFWQMTGMSILRVLAGIASAVLLGLLGAALCHRSALAMQLISPVMTLVKSTPVASFIVLALVWIGRDSVPVFITALMVLPVVWANMTAALAQVDPQLTEMARVFAMPRGRVLRRVTVPSVLPAFRAALSSALGLGWKAGIAAEVLTVPKYAVGRMIYEAKLYLETTELFAWTVTVVLLSLVIERLLLRLVSRIGRERRAADA